MATPGRIYPSSASYYPAHLEVQIRKNKNLWANCDGRPWIHLNQNGGPSAYTVLFFFFVFFSCLLDSLDIVFEGRGTRFGYRPYVRSDPERSKAVVTLVTMVTLAPW